VKTLVLGRPGFKPKFSIRNSFIVVVLRERGDKNAFSGRVPEWSELCDKTGIGSTQTAE